MPSFLPLSHPYVVNATWSFFHTIFKLHKFTQPIGSEGHVTFTSDFWKNFFIYRASSWFSSAYHPQSGPYLSLLIAQSRYIKGVLQVISQNVGWIDYLGLTTCQRY